MTKDKKSEDKPLLPHEEPITADLLMRSLNLTQKIISEVRKRNDEEFGEIEGIDREAMSSHTGYARKKIKASNVFVDNTETYRQRKKTSWLNSTQNKRTGVMYSLKNLVNNGVIGESEVEFFNLPEGIQDYPYRQINNIFRIKQADQTEKISTIEQWVGLSAQASVVTCPVDDLMWFIKPRISYELRTAEGTYLPQGADISNQVTKKAAIIKTTGYLGEVIGDKVYTHEWNEDIFKSCLQLIRGQIDDNNRGCAMTMVNEKARSSIIVPVMEDYLMPFDECWDKYTAKENIFKFNPKDLKSLAIGSGVTGKEPYT